MSAYIVWNDHVKSGTLTAYGTATVNLSVDNLKDRRLAKPARWSGANNGIFGGVTVNFASASKIRVAAFLAHNIASTTIGYDLNIYSGANATGSNLYSASSILPTLAPVDGFPRHEFHVLPSTVTALSMRLTLYGNFPDTAWTTNIGRLWASNALVLDDGIDGDWSMAIADPSQVSRSRGEQVYVDERPRYRILQINRRNLEKAECYNTAGAPTDPSFQLLGFQAGRHGEVIVIPRDDEDHDIHRWGVYGTINDTIKISHQGGDKFAVSMTVAESR
jgi:hypothetical protein